MGTSVSFLFRASCRRGAAQKGPPRGDPNLYTDIARRLSLGPARSRKLPKKGNIWTAELIQYKKVDRIYRRCNCGLVVSLFTSILNWLNLISKVLLEITFRCICKHNSVRQDKKIPISNLIFTCYLFSQIINILQSRYLLTHFLTLVLQFYII